MVNNIFELAEAFLTFEPMTPKKLQKLCYYTQGWSLAVNEEPIFNGDFEAWVHGPVNKSLYFSLKEYGWGNIPKTNRSIDELIENENDRYLISQIYRIYGKLNGDQLEILTHQEKPWINARKGLHPAKASNEIIDANDMREHFRSMLEGA